MDRPAAVHDPADTLDRAQFRDGGLRSLGDLFPDRPDRPRRVALSVPS